MSVSSSKNDTPRVIVALDFPRAEQALSVVRQLSPELCRLKVGKELFTAAGPSLVEGLVRDGYDVFLDLKFHDIPHTVARACSVAADLGVWMVNVHASGGRGMLRAAREALGDRSDRPLLIAVTVLTSLDEGDLRDLGLADDTVTCVRRLALLTSAAGLDGVVCSPLEIEVLRASLGTGFVLVTPGIRPAVANVDDQKRVMTPGEAVRAGSDYLVIGRPVTQAAQPAARLAQINAEIDQAEDTLAEL